MKKYLILTIVILFIGIIFAAGERVAGPAKEDALKVATTNNTKQYQVSFIELGSARCVPCKMMQPIMAEVEKEYPDVQVV
ncbi:MAG: thioredoxin family protein, partial [Candidatus Margulisiibacteriota bacterium]